MTPEKMLGAFVIGNGFVKTWSEWNCALFASVIAVEQPGVDFEGFKSGTDFIIEYGGTRLAVGKTAFKVGRIRTTQMDRGRVGSPFYKNLFAAALSDTFSASGPISIVLTLPMNWYDKRTKVKEFLAGEYKIKRGKKEFCFDLADKDIRIVPEGFGVLMLHLLDEQGKILNRDVAKLNVGVAEIGTGTSDFSAFDALELVPVKSRSINIGLSELWSSVGAEINHLTGRELEPHQIDEAIRNGSFRDSGTVIDIKPIAARHIPSLAQMLVGQMNDLWDEGARDRDYIYTAGGGAPTVYSYFNYSHATLVDNAHSADVAGIYRYARHKNGSK